MEIGDGGSDRGQSCSWEVHVMPGLEKTFNQRISQIELQSLEKWKPMKLCVGDQPRLRGDDWQLRHSQDPLYTTFSSPKNRIVTLPSQCTSMAHGNMAFQPIPITISPWNYLLKNIQQLFSLVLGNNLQSPMTIIMTTFSPLLKKWSRANPFPYSDYVR